MASAWAVYKVRSTRRLGTPMIADSSCQTGPSAVADLRQIHPDAAPVRCQPWDIGTGVTGYVWHAPNPRSVLLLQHGYGEYAQRYVYKYHQLIAHLLHRGVSVYAFDLWGHGHSPGARGLADVGQAVEDHLAARRKLQRQPLPVFVLGHSLGGLVTAASVVRDQRGLRGVVLSSPALHWKTTAVTRVLANVLAAAGPTLPTPTAPTDLRGLSRLPEEVETFAADPRIHHGHMPILLAATALNVMEDTQYRYSAWALPTLVLHGTADTWTDPAGSATLIAAIAASDKTRHLVEGGRHELLNDTDRDATLQVLLTWLEHRLPPSSA